MDSGGPKEACITWSTHIPVEGQLVGDRTCPAMPDETAMSCAKTAEAIDLPFELWTRVA